MLQIAKLVPTDVKILQIIGLKLLHNDHNYFGFHNHLEQASYDFRLVSNTKLLVFAANKEFHFTSFRARCNCDTSNKRWVRVLRELLKPALGLISWRRVMVFATSEACAIRPEFSVF